MASRIRWLIALCVRPSSPAAREKLWKRAAASKARNVRNDGGRSMQFGYQNSHPRQSSASQSGMKPLIRCPSPVLETSPLIAGAYYAVDHHMRRLASIEPRSRHGSPPFWTGPRQPAALLRATLAAAIRLPYAAPCRFPVISRTKTDACLW